MHRKPTHPDPAEAHAARLAWWAAFVATVVLVVGLSLVHTAAAAVPAAATATQPGIFELEPGDDEGEEAEEEELEVSCEAEAEAGEDAAEEAEAGEADEVEPAVECEEEDEEEEVPPQCRLQSADAAVSADLVHRRLHLALRYVATDSAPVAIRYVLRGSRGPLALPSERPRLGRAGVYRATQPLTASQARKVAAARSFSVQVSPAGAPDYCGEYLDQSLTVRHGAHGAPIWTDGETTFRHARQA
ncbi:MAG: hypothetical protein U0R71_07515 [Solirubrobacterales bacterium]